MKSFFREFKKFIQRGNVLDLAIGVIIGAAFSAIVTALTNKIILPLVNLIVYACTGGTSITLITILNGKDYLLADGTINPACIYIDWGAFIMALLNFIIVAFVLFLIIKIANKSNEILQKASKKAIKDIKKKTFNRKERKELAEHRISYRNKAEAYAYFEEKERVEAEKKAEEEAKAKQAEEDAKKNAPEYILKEIRDILKENKKSKKN